MIINDSISTVSTVVLGELPNFEYSVPPGMFVRDVAKQLESSIDLPGVLIKEGKTCLGMVSRRMCFERLSIQYGTELYLQKPIWNLFQTIGISPTIFPSDLSVEHVVKMALYRSPEQRYEPIIVEFPDHNHRIVDLHVILLAQSHLLARANHLIGNQIETGRALSSTLKLSEVINLVLKYIADIVPYDRAEVLLNAQGALKPVASQGDQEGWFLEENTERYDQNVYQEILSSKKSILLPDLMENLSKQEHQHTQPGAWMGIPLLHGDDVVGLLSLARQQMSPFDRNELMLAQSFASQAAIAVQNAQLFEEVQRLATIDPLTKLLNRRHLFNLAGKELEKAIRYKRQLSLIMIDVDHFKMINDRYGHPAGDFVLQCIAARCLESMRDVDIVGRYGGEEFLVIMPETPVQMALQAAERLRSCIADKPFTHPQGDHWITSSLGVAGYDGKGSFMDLDTLLDRADRALYQAKAAGKNRSVVWGNEQTWQSASATPIFFQFSDDHLISSPSRDTFFKTLNLSDPALPNQEHSILRIKLDILAFALNAVEEGIAISNFQGEIQWVNEAFCHLTGYLPEEVMGRSPFIFYNGQNDESLSQSIMSSIGQGIEWQGRLLCRNKQGSSFYENLSIHPILNQQGQPEFFVIVKRAITVEQPEKTHNSGIMNMHQRLAELEAVTRVANAANNSYTLDTLLPKLLEETLSVLNSRAGAIFLYNTKKDILESVANQGWLKNINHDELRPGKGIVGNVFSSGRIYMSDDFASDPATMPANRSIIPADWGGICVPLRTLSGIAGVILVAVEHPIRLSEEDIGLVNTLAEITGNAIHHLDLHLSSEKQLKRLMALKAIDHSITGSTDLKTVLCLLLDHVINLLGVEAAAILLVKDPDEYPKYAAVRGLPEQLIGVPYVNLSQQVRKSTIELQEIAKNGGVKFTLPCGKIDEFSGYLEVPLAAKEKLKGVLQVFHRDPIQPDREWLDYLEILAVQAAIAIHNAQLFEELQQINQDLSYAYDTTVESWDRMLELRDQETKGHTHRVVEKTLALGSAMGISDDCLIDLRRGALLHDVGKVGIPDRILQKPGPLDEDEWLIIKQHPVYVYEMLSGIGFLEKALEIPYCHHEKWDGTGYPRGLKGEEIPLSARIFAVVDVWDALCSNRPYRDAWPEEKTLAYIQSQSGIHFDPQVVDVFLSMFQN